MEGITVQIAGAPISWGVCEVPGWGPMLPADRVLRELISLGLKAIELGSPGFLPATGQEVKDKLDEYDVQLVGGFVPLVLHDPAQHQTTLENAVEWADLLSVAGGDKFVTAVVVDAGWAPRIELTPVQWDSMFEMFSRIDEVCAERGLQQVLHPHIGTLVETAADVQMILDHSNVMWCLDTGHLAIGGYNPVDMARLYPDRIGHVHLKDASLAIGARLNAGELTLMEATFEGMFRSLGRGDIDLDGTFAALAASGYDDWYVLEQDTSIVGEAPPLGFGPVEDIRVSLDFARARVGL
jgi:inosose dehydratase